MQYWSNSDSCFSSDSSEYDSHRFGVLEKLRQVEGKMEEIKTAKERFSKEYSKAEKDIEAVVQGIVTCAQEREKVLKLQLQNIWRENVLEWNRQLGLCLQAEKSLLNIKESGFQMIDDILTTSRPIAERIGCINSGMLELKFDQLTLNKVEGLGKLLPTGRPACPKFIIRGKCEKKGELFQPEGICTDTTGRILVADCANNRIQVFNEFGGFLSTFGKFGSRPGEFRQPTGIATDNKLRIVVSDKRNHRIQVFTYNGRFVLTFGQKGSLVGQFISPRAVAVNEYCEIAVSDTQNRRIQLFSPHGRFLSQFFFVPTLKISPMGIAFKPDNTLLVADCFNNRLLRISKNFAEATFPQGKDLDFVKPVGVAYNGRGGFAVADHSEVKVYDENGDLCRSINGWGDPTKGNSPRDVCFVSDDVIAVAVKNTVLLY